MDEHTSLHLAVQLNSIDIVSLLLSNKDINVNIKDEIQYKNKSNFILNLTISFYMNLCLKPIDYAENNAIKQLFTC